MNARLRVVVVLQEPLSKRSWCEVRTPLGAHAKEVAFKIAALRQPTLQRTRQEQTSSRRWQLTSKQRVSSSAQQGHALPPVQKLSGKLRPAENVVARHAPTPSQARKFPNGGVFCRGSATLVAEQPQKRLNGV